jgi:hypothetical protein
LRPSGSLLRRIVGLTCDLTCGLAHPLGRLAGAVAHRPGGLTRFLRSLARLFSRLSGPLGDLPGSLSGALRNLGGCLAHPTADVLDGSASYLSDNFYRRARF